MIMDASCVSVEPHNPELLFSIDFVCKICYDAYRCYMVEYAPDEFKILREKTTKITQNELSHRFRYAINCDSIPKIGKPGCSCPFR